MQIKSYDLTFISAGNYEYKEEMVILEGPGGELESREERSWLRMSAKLLK